MGAHQVLVAQFEPRRGHRAGHHVLASAEIVGVVGVSGRAVGQHHRRLPGPAGAPGALRVVRRGGRDVAHADDVEAFDVDAELHRRRAVQHRQFGVAEPVLALLAFGRLDLRGVLAGLQTDQDLGGLGVEPAEERVDAALGLVAADRVGCAVFACGGMPFDQAGLDPVAGAAVGLGDPGEDAGVGHRVQQCFDDGLGVGGLEGLIVQRETVGPAQPAPVGAQPGHIQVRRRSPARTWAARRGRRCPSRHRSHPTAPTAPSASPGWPA